MRWPAFKFVLGGCGTRGRWVFLHNCLVNAGAWCMWFGCVQSCSERFRGSEFESSGDRKSSDLPSIIWKFLAHCSSFIESTIFPLVGLAIYRHFKLPWRWWSRTPKIEPFSSQHNFKISKSPVKKIWKAQGFRYRLNQIPSQSSTDGQSWYKTSFRSRILCLSTKFGTSCPCLVARRIQRNTTHRSRMTGLSPSEHFPLQKSSAA